MPKISVIIPVYNKEQYLRDCMDSVCNQTLKDIEIICVNDCSTDHSLEILKEYAQNDERIRIIDLPTNQDVSKARNIALHEAKGDYIGFVDADDTIDPDFYEKLYLKAKETGADIVKGLFNIITGNHSYVTDYNTKIPKNKTYFYAEFTTAIYKNSFLKDNNLCFNEDLNTWEDPLFSIQATKMCQHLELENTVKYHYFRRLGSKAHAANRETIKQWVKAATKFLSYPDTEEDYKIILFDLTLMAVFTCLGNVKNIQDKQYALDEFSKIMQLKPEYHFERDIHKVYKEWTVDKFRRMAKKLREDL